MAESVPTKVCTKCGAAHPPTLEYFSPSKTGRGGLNSCCRECERKIRRKWKLSHPEKVREKVKRWKAKNPEKVKEYRRISRLRRPKKHPAEYYREYRILRRKEISAHRKLLRPVHREQQNIYLKKWKERNKEQFTQMSRAYGLLAEAIKRGRLVRPSSCFRCGVVCKPHAHHHKGYASEHALDVIWLCPSCHGIEHIKQKKLKLSAVAEPQPLS